MRSRVCAIVLAAAVGGCVSDCGPVTEPRRSPSAPAVDARPTPPLASAVSATSPAPQAGSAAASTAPTASAARPCPIPERTVDKAQVRLASTRTTGCKRLPTQKALAGVPDFVVETRCPGPDAATTLEVNTEDDRTFFAVTRSAGPRLPLAPALELFNSPAGTARWFRIGDAPPDAVVITLRASTTDDTGKRHLGTFVVAWELRTGSLCRMLDAGSLGAADIALAIETLGQTTLAGDCECLDPR
ncbi:MAG: hypothetical protein WKG00_34210 [Polyangiaceae bacterium]